MHRPDIGSGYLFLFGCFAMALLVCGSARGDFTFGPPENLGPVVNSSSAEGTISVSADGLEMYFSSNRPGGSGYEELWVSARENADDPWRPPVNLGPPVNSSYRESYPSVSADGLTLYFSDYFYGPDRPGGTVPVKGDRTALRRMNSRETGRSSEVLRLQWQGLVALKGRAVHESLEC